MKNKTLHRKLCAVIKNQAELVSLHIAKPGYRFIIRKYAGCTNVNMRLINMGLRIGDQFEVITNFGQGKIIIAVDYNRYVLGRGIARKIMVEPVKR